MKTSFMIVICAASSAMAFDAPAGLSYETIRSKIAFSLTERKINFVPQSIEVSKSFRSRIPFSSSVNVSFITGSDSVMVKNVCRVTWRESKNDMVISDCSATVVPASIEGVMRL